ncbi:uncharacterized protein RSE6_11477 [Rhynchosporium secalis]|uniref:Uncharacterized protein n=1 Tax=Rhynchosporium secalis TaxID=38038 RepID=A0A1E1MN15_RHYSE|nr:uncharacterized protein RSE6_11477 [Rhynchosporium secalis]
MTVEAGKQTRQGQARQGRNPSEQKEVPIQMILQHNHSHSRSVRRWKSSPLSLAGQLFVIADKVAFFFHTSHHRVKKYTSSITLHENDIPQDALQPIIAPLNPHPQPTQADVQSSTIIRTTNLHTHAIKNVTTLGFQPSTPPSRQAQSICTCLISDLKPAACMQAGMLQDGQNRQVQTTFNKKAPEARQRACRQASLLALVQIPTEVFEKCGLWRQGYA